MFAKCQLYWCRISKIKVEPYQSGLDWEDGVEKWEINDYQSHEDVDNPPEPFLLVECVMRDYEWLFANWKAIHHQRHGMSAFMKETPFQFHVREYLLKVSVFCSEYVRHSKEQCSLIKANARKALDHLPYDLKEQADLKKMESRFRWLRNGEDK